MLHTQYSRSLFRCLQDEARHVEVEMSPADLRTQHKVFGSNGTGRLEESFVQGRAAQVFARCAFRSIKLTTAFNGSTLDVSRRVADRGNSSTY